MVAEPWFTHSAHPAALLRQFSRQAGIPALAGVCVDELAMMNLRRNELALVREVYLYCGDTPVVFAHSVVARKDLRGAWRGLSGLGNRSLGTVLFTNPVVKRTPLRFKKLNSTHPLFIRACRHLQAKPPGLWARRSLFSLQGQSILVTEVFLPSILELASVTLTQRLGHYEKLMRLDKPIGILLLLWPTLWGLWLAAGGVPRTDILVIFVLGTVLMRSAGCVVNDYADRNFDSHVERTKNRPLATGKLSSKEALLLAAGLSLCAFLLILPLNRLTLALSVLALFLAASYPFTKRFFAMPQAYLGIAFSFGIPMAFAAQTGEVPYIAWLLMVANLLWVIAYDTEYAIVDKVDDLKIGIKTSAITFGRFDVAGRDAVPYPVSVRHDRRGADPETRHYLLRGSHRRAGIGVLPVPPDSRSRPRSLLQGLSAQQLGRRDDFRWYRA